MPQPLAANDRTEVAWKIGMLRLVAPGIGWDEGARPPTPEGLKEIHGLWQERAGAAPDGFAVGFIRLELVAQDGTGRKAYAELSMTDGELYLSATT